MCKILYKMCIRDSMRFVQKRPPYANHGVLEYGLSREYANHPFSAVGLLLSPTKIMQVSKPQAQDPGLAGAPNPWLIPFSRRRFLARSRTRKPCSFLFRFAADCTK